MAATELCRLTTRDAAALEKLAQSVGWNTSIATWRDIIRCANSKVYGYRSKSGRIIASAALFKYGLGMSALGMVITNPRHQRQGFAKKLVCHIINNSRDRTIALIASEEGFSLYSRLGFKTTESIVRMMANNLKAAPSETTYKIASFNKLRLPAIHNLDATIIGGDRGDILDACIKRAHSRLILLENKTITGFGLARKGLKHTVIGPVIASSVNNATLLIRRLSFGTGHKVSISVPSSQKKLLTMLAKWGFVKKSEYSLMVLNASKMPGQRRQLFAIAANSYL